MPKLFGTDGIRGIANRDLTGELAFALGRAAVGSLGSTGEGAPRVLVGRDTRASGEFLEAALAAGICSAGGHVLLLGVCTTPGVAFLTRALGADAGAVISASHNPADYNGIKFFGSSGYKLPDEVERQIEGAVDTDAGPRPTGRGIGRIDSVPDANERYLRFLEESAADALSGMRIVVDCAHGAASEAAPEVLRRLGADVIPINDRPDGWNINERAGATVPEMVAAAVTEIAADAGVAHDGDADRAIFADGNGNVVDGDHVLAACALDMKERGELAENLVVTTVMANLGFRKAIEAAGIRMLETKVGDRYVLEEMLKTGAVLGGEQSGHIIFLEHATTGDGLLTALQFLGRAHRKGMSIADFASCMTRFPQVLANVHVGELNGLAEARSVWEAVAAAEHALGDRGRVLVRPSGTEPVVRVMVEAATEEEARTHADSIAEAVVQALGAG
ncbi:MAG TPA: phosphoglucosamine mutase [Actinomycetota bacterium]|nr:phosphoglucosamine mutase [Actinomycetota bacterium]